MSETTPNLSLPLLMPSQAQKHVTHNEALAMLDALVHLSVLDRDLAQPPADPAEGSAYLVAAAPGGEWGGQAGRIAVLVGGGWSFREPRAGWVVFVADEKRLLVHDGTGFSEIARQGGQVSTLGVNAAADATNRLSVRAAATLFNHEGAGHQLKLNKAAAGETATLLFQSGFSGRAEFGLAGNDRASLKVSANGADWVPALSVEPSNGHVGLGAASGAPPERLTVAGNVAPAADNAHSCGTPARRWTAIHAATGVVQTSDLREKSVAGDLAGLAPGIVDAVRPILFRWRGQGGGAPLHAGFAAQEVEAAISACGTAFEAAGRPDDPGGRWFVRPDQLLAVLWEALRETRAEVAAMRRAGATAPGAEGAQPLARST